MNDLESNEILNLLRVAKAARPRVHAMCLLAYVHGMRADEVCGLLMTDVDVARETVVVRRKKGSLTTTQSFLHQSWSYNASWISFAHPATADEATGVAVAGCGGTGPATRCVFRRAPVRTGLCQAEETAWRSSTPPTESKQAGIRRTDRATSGENRVRH